MSHSFFFYVSTLIFKRTRFALRNFRFTVISSEKYKQMMRTVPPFSFYFPAQFLFDFYDRIIRLSEIQSLRNPFNMSIYGRSEERRGGKQCISGWWAYN